MKTNNFTTTAKANNNNNQGNKKRDDNKKPTERSNQNRRNNREAQGQQQDKNLQRTDQFNDEEKTSIRKGKGNEDEEEANTPYTPYIPGDTEEKDSNSPLPQGREQEKAHG